MVNTCEPVHTTVNGRRAKVADKLRPKGEEAGDGFNGAISWSKCFPVDSRHLTPRRLQKRNVVTSYLRPQGQVNRKGNCWSAGLGGRKKRRPSCNGADTGFNVTRHESEPTSDWCLFARAYGEHLKRGKQMGDGGGSTTRLCAPSSGWPELVPTC